MNGKAIKKFRKAISAKVEETAKQSIESMARILANAKKAVWVMKGVVGICALIALAGWGLFFLLLFKRG